VQENRRFGRCCSGGGDGGQQDSRAKPGSQRTCRRHGAPLKKNHWLGHDRLVENAASLAITLACSSVTNVPKLCEACAFGLAWAPGLQYSSTPEPCMHRGSSLARPCTHLLDVRGVQGVHMASPRAHLHAWPACRRAGKVLRGWAGTPGAVY